MGPLPFTNDLPQNQEALYAGEQAEESESTSKPKILADGTYATQSYIEEEKQSPMDALHLRHALLNEKYYLYAYLCACLVKLSLKSAFISEVDITKNRILESIQIMIELYELGTRQENKVEIDEITKNRIQFCINVFLNPHYRQYITSLLIHDGKQSMDSDHWWWI